MKQYKEYRRFYRICLDIFFVFLFFSVYVYSVNSQSNIEILRKNINEKNVEIKKIEAEIDELNKKILNTKQEASTLKEEINKLQTRKDILAKEISITELNIQKTKDQITESEAEINELNKKINTQESALFEILNKLHRNTDYGSQINFFFDSGNLINLLSVYERELNFSQALAAKIQSLKTLKEEAIAIKNKYENQKKALIKYFNDLEDKKNLAEQNKKEAEILLRKTKNKESEYQKFVADKKKKKREIEQEILDFEARLKIAIDATKLPSAGGGVLAYPLAKVVITQYFGNTPFASKNPQVYNGGGHNGVDFAASVGTPILAARGGVVTGVGDTDTACYGVSYGKWILIKHDNGLSTLYAHLSLIKVSVGQIVSTGEAIGLSGNTGYSTGPHLHFTVFATEGVRVSEIKSKVCGTTMTLPTAPRNAYLNPLSYLK